IDLDQFQRWYEQAGTPVLEVGERFEGGVLELTVSQRCPPTPGQPVKAPFHVPVLLGLLDADGNDLDPDTLEIDASDPVESRRTASGRSLLLHLRSPQAKLTVRGLSARPRVSFLRSFSAPVRVEYPRPT